MKMNNIFALTVIPRETLKHIFFGFFIILCFGTPLFAQFEGEFSESDQPTVYELYDIREELKYKVYYGFLMLGYVEVTRFRDTTYHGKPSIYYKSVMKSNPDLFFIGRKEEHFHSITAKNDSIFYGLKFWSDNYHKDIPNELIYETNPDYTEVTFEVEGEMIDTLEVTEPSLLGPDIYMYARLFAGSDTTLNSPIYVAEEYHRVTLNFQNKVKMKKYDAFDEEIPTYYMDGDAPFEGPFGFSGSFKAWFGADSLRIPLEAHAKVWIGSVKVKLTSYERIR
jgi:hypothetical protein